MTEPLEAKVVRVEEDYGATWLVTCGACRETFQAVLPSHYRITVTCRNCRVENTWETNFADLGDRGWVPA